MSPADFVGRADAELLQLAPGSQEAFSVLVDRYHKRLYTFVKRLYFLEHEEIEDILQESFIKLYRNLHAYNPSFAVSTWLYQLTRHIAIDYLRKKRIQPKTIVLEDDEWERVAIATPLFSAHTMDMERVKQTLLKLPLAYREAFTLFYLEEKTYEEMIDILKKPKGTIASLLNRAKKMMRNELERTLL